MTIKINGIDYTFKTSFDEFTIDEYLPLTKFFTFPVVERVSAFTSIPVEILNGLTVENFNHIAEAVSFIEQETILNALAEPFEGKDIALDSFQKIEKAKGIISDIIAVAELYTGTEVKGKQLLSQWNKCVFYLRSITAFFERFKELSLHEYTEEELEADVELLEGFKHYPIVFKYGKNRGMTNDEVLQVPAIEIYTELLYDYRISEYEKRYSEVVRNRQEHFSKVK